MLMVHDMQNLMVGMFWGGFVMAIPPVAVGVAIAWFLVKHQRALRAAERAERQGE
jgi:hypothetical protein